MKTVYKFRSSRPELLYKKQLLQKWRMKNEDLWRCRGDLRNFRIISIFISAGQLRTLKVFNFLVYFHSRKSFTFVEKFFDQGKYLDSRKGSLIKGKIHICGKVPWYRKKFTCVEIFLDRENVHRTFLNKDYLRVLKVIAHSYSLLDCNSVL